MQSLAFFDNSPAFFYILEQSIQTTTRHFDYYKHRRLKASKSALEHSIEEVFANVAENEFK